jgi:hypothetical protein
MGIFQTLPTISQEASDAERRIELRQARAWVSASRQTIAEVRAGLASAPPLPTGLPANLREAFAVQERSFPELANSIEQYVTRVSATFDALERGDPQATIQGAVNSLDAITFTYKLMRDVNRGQAESIGASHPQSYVLRSIARSYDALLAFFAFKRSALLSETGDREGAAQAAQAAAADLRGYVEAGRRAAVALRAQLQTARASSQDERLLKERALGTLNTFDASFAAELRMVGLLESLARLLRDSRSDDDMAPEFDALLTQFDEVDAQRIAASQQRIAILQGQ